MAIVQAKKRAQIEGKGGKNVQAKKRAEIEGKGGTYESRTEVKK